MRKFISLTLIAAVLSGCATRSSVEPQSELYPYPPGSLGHPDAQTTLISGVLVLALGAVLIHSIRDR